MSGAEAKDIEDGDDVGGVSGEEEENEIEEVVEARGEGARYSYLCPKLKLIN
jgi:hypothetical protein